MFRDYEIKYVAASVLLAWTLAILLGYYEIFIDRTDTALQTAVAIVQDTGAAVGTTLLLVGTWEVFSVLARRINERLLAEARQEGRREEQLRRREEQMRWREEQLRWREEQLLWREWYYSLPKEDRDKFPPPPENGR